MPITLNPTQGLRDETIFPDEPGSSAAAREQIQGIIDQVVNQINTRLPDKISETIFATWDMANSGTQTISGFSGTPKRIEIRAYVNDAASLIFSNGSYEAGNNTQSMHSVYRSAGGAVLSGGTNDACVSVSNSGGYNSGVVSSVANGSIAITWTKGGTPASQVVNLQVVAHYS